MHTLRKDNRGLSLVELLVAIAITAVITGTITYLLRTSLNFFGNETTNVALQQELQLTLNQVMDYAMESQEVVISGDDTATNYVAFGKIVPKVSDTDTAQLDAQIIWKDGSNLYLMKDMVDDIEKEAEDGTLPATIGGKITAVASTKNNYLLAEYVSAFKVSANGLVTESSEYKNPLSLDINIEFNKSGSTKDVHKNVNDKAVLRNRIKLPIFVNGVKYKLKKESAKLETITEFVEKDQVLYGDVHYVATGGSSQKTKVTVIEVIPEPALSMIGYLVGGKEPIDSDGVDASANQMVGHLKYDTTRLGYMNENSNLLTNNMSGSNATIYNFMVGTGTYNGYFEKVNYNDSNFRRGRGGVYAFNSNANITGFDDISFVSEYSSYGSTYSKEDYCWVWREQSDIPGEGYSVFGNNDIDKDYKKEDILNAPAGARIYLINCMKNKVVNNEMFILYCMGHDKSNGSYGLCQGMGAYPDYYVQNNQEVRKINKDNIELLSYTPAELSSHVDELKRADLIFFLGGSGGIYNNAANLLSVEEPYMVNGLPNGYTSDIGFEEMKYIYNAVVNYKLGIVTSRPTANSVNGKYKNLNNLFYMLYGMENTNVVYSDGKMYGTDNNRYYINDQQKVNDIKAEQGSSAYLWSGRMIFTDFFKSNFQDKTAYSYENQVVNKRFTDDSGTVFTTVDFLHYREDSCLSVSPVCKAPESGEIGDIVIGPKFGFNNASAQPRSWYSNVFTKWQGSMFGDHNNFNQISDRYGNRVLGFLIDDYYKSLGFRPASNNNTIGVFANQAMIEDDGFLIKYNPYSSTGSLGWLGTVVSATNSEGSSGTEEESVGTIELVGYAVGKDVGNPNGTRDDGKYNVPDDISNKTYEQCVAEGMRYQHEFESLANNLGKGLYLSYEELEQAKQYDNGVFIYMVVRSSVDFYPTLSNDNPFNPYVYYDPHQDPNSTEKPPAPLPSEIYTEYAGEAVKYKGGTGEKERYVTEFRAHIPALYFSGDNASLFGKFFPPTNYGNNRMIARIGIDEGEHIPYLKYAKTKEIAGSEVFYIAIRDLFDLD